MKMTREIFCVRVIARFYELDANGHVAGATLLQYGQHARSECLRAAGIDGATLQRAGLGPVSLEETIRFHGEVSAGDEIEVTCDFSWGDGKTFQVHQQLRRPDGTLIAEITNVGGLMNLNERRLIPNPAARCRAAARTPAILNL
jgi:acyl-CoA thioester hydrolase